MQAVGRGDSFDRELSFSGSAAAPAMVDFSEGLLANFTPEKRKKSVRLAPREGDAIDLLFVGAAVCLATALESVDRDFLARALSDDGDAALSALGEDLAAIDAMAVMDGLPAEAAAICVDERYFDDLFA